jgi:hypothetical protein
MITVDQNRSGRPLRGPEGLPFLGIAVGDYQIGGFAREWFRTGNTGQPVSQFLAAMGAQ